MPIYDATYQLTQSLPTVLREDKEHRDEKGKRNEHDSDSDSKRGQEVSEGHHEHTRNHRAENFVYGAVGNRLRGPGHADASVYNELNQLLANRTEEFRYDANGNLIYKAGLADDDEDDYEQQGWSYEYDLENRMVKANKAGTHGSRSISFKYDPFGRRIEKKVEKTEHGETESRITTYVYDNEDIILEISGKNTSRYVHGPGIDEPLAMEQKRSTYFFHADGLGSIVNLTDQRGRVVQSYEYSSFGRMKEHGGEVKQPYGYTGREWDKELGLYYYRARYYDPKGGRFISKDPIGFEGGDVNLYRYVQNNPVNYTDPEGLATEVYTRFLKIYTKFASEAGCRILKDKVKMAEEENSECRQLGEDDNYRIDPEAYRYIEWCNRMYGDKQKQQLDKKTIEIMKQRRKVQ